MTLYVVLFFLGFMLAVCLLAYASMQVAELNKKTELFGKNLTERYSKPLIGLEDLVDKKGSEKKAAEDIAEAKPETKPEKPGTPEKPEEKAESKT